MHKYLVSRGLRDDYILVTLTLFSRSYQHFEMLNFDQKRGFHMLSLELNKRF